MTTPTEAELAAFARNADELRGELGRFINTNTGGNAQTLTVHAANPWIMGVLLAVALVSSAACGVSVGMVFSIRGDLARQEQDAREIRDYVQALYRQVPELRKIAEKEKDK